MPAERSQGKHAKVANPKNENERNVLFYFLGLVWTPLLGGSFCLWSSFFLCLAEEGSPSDGSINWGEGGGGKGGGSEERGEGGEIGRREGDPSRRRIHLRKAGCGVCGREEEGRD